MTKPTPLQAALAAWRANPTDDDNGDRLLRHLHAAAITRELPLGELQALATEFRDSVAKRIGPLAVKAAETAMAMLPRDAPVEVLTKLASLIEAGIDPSMIRVVEMTGDGMTVHHDGGSEGGGATLH